MMSGSLTIPGGRFGWVYDCGSNQTNALTREISHVAGRGDLACLFLSHLDSDHISGVDQLLAATDGATEVVLPYLDEVDRLIAIAHDSLEGRLTGNLLTCLADIPGWFATRGVVRLTFIIPRDDDDILETPGPDFPGGGEDGGEGKITTKWSPAPDTTSIRLVGKFGSPFGIAVQSLTTDSHLSLRASSGMLDWVLAPYAHRPSAKKFKVFRSALFKAFGRNYRTPNFLASLLQQKNAVAILREAYDQIWSDHNLVSMALYAGPLSSSPWQGQCYSHNHDRWHRGTQVGWLGTGDAHLKSGQRRAAFLRHYQVLLEQVNVFGLPHHGSHRNFGLSLPDEMPYMTQCVAAAGPNGYGHPHKVVEDAVRYAGRQFIQVSHREETSLQWRHTR
jgi:hypothetical protein